MKTKKYTVRQKNPDIRLQELWPVVKIITVKEMEHKEFY